jgi:DNA-binding GntR family transcriptional regulator
VCPIISDERINEMEHIATEQERLYSTGDIEIFNDLNRKFHLSICKDVDNIYYEKFLNELINICDIYILFFDRFVMQKPEESATLREHRNIIAALRAHDVEECVLTMKLHHETTLNQLDTSMFKRTTPKNGE